MLRFLQDQYVEQLLPILQAQEESSYYAITFDILGFIYEFPEIGELFQSFHEEFLEFIKIALQTIQMQLIID